MLFVDRKCHLIMLSFVIADTASHFAHECSLSEMGSRVDSRNSKGIPEEENCGVYHPKPHPAPPRPNNNLHSNPCTSPKSSHQFIYPYNGSTPVLHTGTNSHHPLDTMRRLHHSPLVPVCSTSSSNTSFSCSAAQRLPHTHTPPNVSQGQRTPKTPDTPGSPRLGSLSSPPPSSPMGLGGGGRGTQTHTHNPHSVIVGGSPLSSSPSSVHNMNCASPHQRSRHPSASPSPLSEQGGSSTAAEGGLLGSNMPQRRKSTSSSPHSPVPGGSPNPSPHFHRNKLEDILEQFKNSGNSSTNNKHLLNPSLLTNQNSSNPETLALKPSKSVTSPTSSTGPPVFGLSSAGPSSLTGGPFLNHHHSHQGKPSHPSSFPASSLLSAAAKAQLANQVTQSQSLNAANSPVSLPSSLEVLKEAQLQQSSSKVTNSTLHNSHPPSFITSTRPPHPSLPTASTALFPQPSSLAQSLASSLPHLAPAAERSASHRKRQRRSPTVLNILKDTQQLANGLQNPGSGDAVNATVINLSTASPTFPSSSLASSTSAVQNQYALETYHHHLLHGHMHRLPAPLQMAQFSRHARQTEALDFTTGSTPSPLGLDPPTQPLSALLHLLSVQNAQATASATSSASAQSGSVQSSGHTNKQSPRLSPSSFSSHSIVRHSQTRSPCRTNDTNSPPPVPRPLSPPPASSQFRSVQSHSQPQPTKSCPPQRHSSPLTVTPKSNLALHNSSSLSQHMSPTPSDKHQPSDSRIPTVDSVSKVPLQESSPHGCVAAQIGVDSVSTSVVLDHSQGSVSVAMATSPKPLDLSNHVLAILAASSTPPQGDTCPSDQTADIEVSSQGNYTAGKNVTINM